jgi:cardiolipin synthase
MKKIDPQSAVLFPVNLPIALTWLRIVAIPLLVGVYALPDHWVTVQQANQWACGLFVIASVTDWLDGYLARKWHQTSEFGAFLDPVADKLMVCAALVMLLQLGRVEALLAFVIIGREITISALREWMAQLGAGQSVAVSSLGKFKTASQMIAIPLLLWHQSLNVWGLTLDIHQIGAYLLHVAALLTVWSMLYYFRKAVQQLRQTVQLKIQSSKHD